MMAGQEPSYFAIISADVRYDEDLIPSAKLLYGEITALSNKKGVCWATNDYFAKLYKTSEKTITRWVKNLEEKGYIATNVQTFRYEDGTVKKVRYIALDKNKLNHTDKNVQNHTDKNVQNHTDKNVQNQVDENVPYNNTKNNSKRNNNKLNEEDIKNEFLDQVWNEYPRRQGRENALKAYIKARKEGVDKDTVLDGIRAYKAFLTANKTNSKYIKQGSTWFNQKCWEDDYNIEPSMAAKKPINNDFDYLEEMEEERMRKALKLYGEEENER